MFFFSLTIIFHLLDLLWSGCWAIAWFFYMCFATYLTSVRIETRERFKIVGNPFEDFFACLFLYSNAVVQMDLTTRCLDPENDDVDDGGKKSSKDPENGLPMGRIQPEGAGGNVNEGFSD